MMRGHIIPQVYQRKWHTTNGDNNVYYFTKDNLLNPIDNNGGNVKNNLYEIDEYIINDKDNEYGLIRSDNYELEHYFDNEYENKWNDIVENSSIVEFLEQAEIPKGNCNVAIPRSCLVGTPFESKLLMYTIMQFFRVYNNFKSVDKGLIDKISDICISIYENEKGTLLSPKEKSEVIGNENYMRCVWKQLLLDCKNDNKTNSILSIVYDGLKDTNLTFIYVKNNISTKFILSDNPVVWNTGDNKKYTNLESGIFFPILPNLMVAYLKYSERDPIKPGDALCLFANDNFVKYMNSILLSQSKEKIGFMNKSLSSHIDSNVDIKKAWNQLFNH